MRRFWRRSKLGLCLIMAALAGTTPARAACVWKVTNNRGQTLYLGGSIHALQSTDYPLPPAYNRAFDASSRLLFEVDLKALNASSEDLVKAGLYRKGDSLKNHVDPRTYDYLKRLFGLMKVPEKMFAKYRPWFLVLALEDPGSRGLSQDLGVERFLTRRAQANKKSITGLETAHEHAAIFEGLSDRQSEALLLITFIPRDHSKAEGLRLLQAWRSGDADVIASIMKEGYSEFPAFGDRILGARNRAWIPKIERAMESGETYFVVAGAAHMGGSQGVLTLLRERGYHIEPV